jgi:hypothetical protein
MEAIIKKPICKREKYARNGRKGRDEMDLKNTKTHAFFCNGTGYRRTFHLAFGVHNDASVVLKVLILVSADFFVLERGWKEGKRRGERRGGEMREEAVTSEKGKSGNARGEGRANTYLKVEEYTISPAPGFTLADNYCGHG